MTTTHEVIGLFDELLDTAPKLPNRNIVPAPSREQVWMQAWCAAVHCPELLEPSDCNWWADKCLEAFDQRFPTPKY